MLNSSSVKLILSLLRYFNSLPPESTSVVVAPVEELEAEEEEPNILFYAPFLLFFPKVGAGEGHCI